ncbi:MAG: ThuA domain-containing protein, partial [Victivallales bacterium]|nr:ThuA domain-containing protein [Victivallales bacterium]
MAKRALITWGGWEGHEPEQCAEVAENILLNEGFEVVSVTSLSPFADAELMESFDLFVPVWTMAEISPEESSGLLKSVREGAGIAGWHGGMGDSFR